MSSPKRKRYCTHSAAGGGQWHGVLSGMDLDRDMEGITKCLSGLDRDALKVSSVSVSHA